MIDNIKVGRAIMTLRQERGMTQQQLAAAVSVSHQAVSKWENGAALPDIQTMLELTRLFGITVEQLIEGDISSDENFRDEKMADAHMQDGIACEVSENENNMTDDHDSTNGAYGSEEPEHAPEDEYAEDAQRDDGSSEHFDVQKLLKMAPFMSKEALDSILLENRSKLTPDDIAKFAPFVSRNTLEKLVQNTSGEINWDTLQRIAPFLKRDMVDVLARAAAKGERIMKKVVKKTERSAAEIEASFEDVSQKIGAGMGKIARHAMKFGEDLVDGISAAFSDQNNNAKTKVNRAQSLRVAALERAMTDGRWDWISVHLSEVQDEALRGKIAQTAIDQGMIDWVKIHLPEYADINDAESALEDGDWDAVAAVLKNMDKGYRVRAALKAASQHMWTWLSENAGSIDFGENAARIAMLAYESNMKDMAITIAETKMAEHEVEELANQAIIREDYDFAGQLSHLLSSDFLESVCKKLALEGQWAHAEEFLPLIEEDGIVRLMELAISQGDFEAVDILDNYLDA